MVAEIPETNTDPDPESTEKQPSPDSAWEDIGYNKEVPPEGLPSQADELGSVHTNTVIPGADEGEATPGSDEARTGGFDDTEHYEKVRSWTPEQRRAARRRVTSTRKRLLKKP